MLCYHNNYLMIYEKVSYTGIKIIYSNLYSPMPIISRGHAAMLAIHLNAVELMYDYI